MRALRHPKVPGAYFDVNVGRRKINPSEVYSPDRAGKLLGMHPDDVRDLVEQRLLKKKPLDSDGHVRGEELLRFRDQLEPVELEIREKSASTSEAPDQPPTDVAPKATAPAKPTASAPKATAPPATPKATPKLVAEAEDQDDDDEAEETFTARCPGCDEDLEIHGAVESFRCPSCGQRLSVARPIDEADAAADENPEPRRNPFLGVFGRGQRK